MLPLAAILSLLIMISGWYYMFYSKAARDLSAIEDPRQNRLRSGMRRTNGAAMLLLGILLFAGVYRVDFDHPTRGFFLIWSAVFILLVVIVVLAIADVRLTWKLRRRHKQIDP